MATVIRDVLTAFPVWCLLLALIVAAIRIARGASNPALVIAREVCFYALGIAGLWGFFFHVFMQSAVAPTLGWQSGGFETEVGMANLALAVPGLMCPRQPKAFILATVIAATCFLGGAAVNHIVLIVRDHNSSPGNAGPILWTDILIPAIALIATLLTPGDEDPLPRIRRRYTM